MRNLQEATERICELKGSLLALEVLAWALAMAQDPRTRGAARVELARHAEAARSALLPQSISEHTLMAFDDDMARHGAHAGRWPGPAESIEPLLLGTTPVHTYAGGRHLTSASGFLFARGDARFLVTCRHVLEDAAAHHHPDHVGIELHLDEHRLPQVARVDLPLGSAGQRTWRWAEAADGSAADIAAVRLWPGSVPPDACVQWFQPAHADAAAQPSIEVGEALAIVGFPLGFFDTVNRLPVLRQATLASSLRVGFQGTPTFLTDARTHRGMSGAPVVVRWPGSSLRDLPYRLLGVHAARMDMGDREPERDESLGLNTAWSADLLEGLTDASHWPS